MPEEVTVQLTIDLKRDTFIVSGQSDMSNKIAHKWLEERFNQEQYKGRQQIIDDALAALKKFLDQK